MADSNLYVEFFIHPVLQPEESKKEGRPIYKDEAYISIQIKGQKNSIFTRKMKDQDKYDHAQAWARFEAEEEELKSGTPVTAIPGVGPSVKRTLEGMGIRTVEDLAELTDAGIMNITGGRTLHQRAVAYLAAAEIKPEQEHEEEMDDPVDVEALNKDHTVIPKKRAPKKKAAKKRSKAA